MIRQSDLFAPSEAAADKRPPNVAYIRKRLGGLLRVARQAEVLPWSEAEAGRLAAHFPALARALPVGEAEAICREFEAELQRLTSEKAA